MDEPASPETLRQLDELARGMLSAKQRADLQELPVALCDLDHDELLAKAKDALVRHRRFRQAFEEVDDAADIDDELVAVLFRGEILWRTICHAIADEIERRRTGVAPRAKGLN